MCVHVCPSLLIFAWCPADDEQPEDSASRWREGVLQDAGASAAFASAFSIPTVNQQLKPEYDVRDEWTPAAAQVSQLLFSVPEQQSLWPSQPLVMHSKHRCLVSAC